MSERGLSEVALQLPAVDYTLAADETVGQAGKSQRQVTFPLLAKIFPS